MEKNSKVIRIVEELFPEHQAYLNKRFKTVHSEIFIIDITKDKNEVPQKVLVKFCGSNNSVEVLNEFRNLSIFNKECKDNRIGVPEPLAVDPGNGILVMEYIKGVSLKDLLLKLKPVNEDNLSKIINLSAIALSKFHFAFRDEEHKDILIDSPLLTEDVKNTLNNNEILSQCNLQIRAKSFIDFAAWNIIINDNMESKVYLIDFPERECICTPHLDFAGFKFSLETIKQYPQFRFLRMNWWDVDTIFNIFLNRYCKEIGVNLNKYDMHIMNYFMREYARKLQDIYNVNKSNMRLKLEGLYLRHFIETLVDKGNI